MSKIQYTIRNVPPVVDRVIRKRAKQTGESFNKTVVELLTQQTLGTLNPVIDYDFDWLYGANTLDDSFDEAINDLSRVDEKLWR